MRIDAKSPWFGYQRVIKPHVNAVLRKIKEEAVTINTY
jgi:hypothetical protein